MPRENLTQTLIDTVICDADKSKVDYFDTKVRGLLLKVLKSGKKNYYLRYKNERNSVVEKRLASSVHILAQLEHSF